MKRNGLFCVLRGNCAYGYYEWRFQLYSFEVDT